MKKRICFAVAVALTTASHAVAPQLSSITPPGGQRAAETSVTFAGRRLADIREIVFHEPGIEVAHLEASGADTAKCLFRIKPDCRLGEHLLRVRTATGVSELRSFFVGPFPSTAETEPNNDIARAQRIDLDTTVEGIVQNEDVDGFLVSLKKGQRLSAEVEGIRLGRTLYDPYLSIQTTNGAVLAESDDTPLFLQDSALSIAAPADGDYIIQLRDSAFEGSGNAAYRLHIGGFPRPRAVYPLGGQAGAETTFTFLGDPAGEFTRTLKLPESGASILPLAAEQGGKTAPSAFRIRVSPFPGVLEAEPNNQGAQATLATNALPIALNGRLAEPGDTDWFRFAAHKGQTLDIEVHAQRLRSRLDSVLNIYDATGKYITGNEDAGSHDSALRFSPPGDGEYLLRISDHQNRGGIDFVYRVELLPADPRVEFTIPHVARNDSQSRQTIVVPRGNRFMTLINARRINFSGDIQLSLDNPPEGIRLVADILPGNLTTFPLVFEAATNAPVSGTIARLDGSLLKEGQSTPLQGGFHQDADLVLGQPNNTVYYRTRVQGLHVAVTDELPFRIQVEQPNVPIVRDGDMSLGITVERKEGFEDPVTLYLPFRPPGIGAQYAITVPKGATSARYPINANGGAQIRDWKFAVLASAPVSGGTAWASSQLANLAIADRYVTMKLEKTEAHLGSTASVLCKLEHKTPFKEKARLKLLGLPHGVTAEEVDVAAGQTEVRIPVQVSEKAAVGGHKNLYCHLTLTENGEPIVHRGAYRGILLIVDPKKVVKQAKAE